MPPVLLATAIAVAAYICCVFPFLIVAGPLVCGLDCCAINSLRGRSIEMATLKRGRRVAGRAILAFLAIQLLFVLPFLLIIALVVAVLAIAGAIPPELFAPPPNPGGGQNIPAIEQPAEKGAARHADIEPPQAGAVAPAVPPGGGQLPGNPSPWEFLVLFAFYAVAIVGLMLGTLWTLWLGTRLQFVLPLIADRQTDVKQAFRLSWESTREGFWELLLLYAIAELLVMLGMQLCYIGMIFTLPLALTLIASAYVERFPEETAEPELDDGPVSPDAPTAT